MLLMGIPSWNEAMKLSTAQRLEAFADPAYASVLVEDMERSLRPGNAARDALGRDGRGAPSDSDAEQQHDGGSEPATAGDVHMASCVVGSVTHQDNLKYVGRELREIASAEGKPVGQVLLEISLRDNLDAEFKLEGRMNSDKAAVARMVQHPLVQLGASDAGAHVTQFCGTGDTSFFLERYVKHDKSMTLEAGINQLTGALSESWGMRNRGLLRPGRAADLCLFDLDRLENGEQVNRPLLSAFSRSLLSVLFSPQEFADDMPGNASRYTRRATGFSGVWVNGVRVLQDDEYTELRPGCGQLV